MIKQPLLARELTPVKSARLIEALGGDQRSGMCPCVAHGDDNPSLHISEVGGKILFYCFAGCTQTAVLDALRRRGLWPVPGSAPRAPTTPRRTDEERREYALKILVDTAFNRGVERSEFLIDYFVARGIKTVPATAMLGMPFSLADHPHLLIPRCPAMIFAVTNGAKIIGAHVTYLESVEGRLTAKRSEAPQRQFFGPISGGYVRLYNGELKPTARIIIAEGVETAMAAAQIAGGLPAIAALSATNLSKITPPRAAEFIVAADHDAAGIAGAEGLASKLARAGAVVRLAVPPQPGADWNDVLLSKLTP